MSSRLGFAIRRLENFVNPAVNGYLLQTGEGQGRKRRGMGSAFHLMCPIYSGTLIPTAPTAIRLWENLPLPKRKSESCFYILLITEIEDLTRVVISYEIYETSLRRVS